MNGFTEFSFILVVYGENYFWAASRLEGPSTNWERGRETPWTGHYYKHIHLCNSICARTFLTSAVKIKSLLVLIACNKHALHKGVHTNTHRALNHTVKPPLSFNHRKQKHLKVKKNKQT